jgi:acetylornithine/succinyldiaminopimelate/putrescine aminotransferase
MGQRIAKAVGQWDSPLVSGLRGRGLMLGFQLDAEAVGHSPRFAGSGRTPALFVIDALHQAGLLTVPAGQDVVRWLPPMVVTAEQVDEALAIFADVLQSLTA